uniref:Pre-mRNA-splicing factor ISY1 homolog n=1 Tax=Propithecus coquereli TaxID=379532 RepID=A0A2K6GI40_PROCO
MARNAEKAMTALARFRQAQLEEGKVKERRPFLASECTELPKAEKWRRQIIGEISKKVAQIQNALPPPRKTRAELMKAIDFEYYGYLDEDDGVIVPLEQEYEKKSDEEGSQEKGGDDGQQKFIAHVPVPSQQEIEEALVRRKKMELLQKYASETLQAQSEEAKRLLGY